MRILAINPGGTSTKISVFDDDIEILKNSIMHSDEELINFKSVFEEFPFRMEKIIETLEGGSININSLDAVAGRGGLLKAIEGGTYEVNEVMISDVKNAINGEHPSNLGCVLAKNIADKVNIPSYVVDPVSVDEFSEVSRITGISDIEKASWLHALNQKAVCRMTADKMGKAYEDINAIVCHLGSGISIAAHKNGRMVDGGGGRVDGPFSPERSGSLPTYPLVQLCYSGKYTEEEMVSKISKTGGMYDYLGTKDLREIENMANGGNDKARVVTKAFIQQIAKDIGGYATVLDGDVDRIVITGGIAHSKTLMDQITHKIDFIAPVDIIPGEMEMSALAEGVIRVLSGKEKSKLYI